MWEAQLYSPYDCNQTGQLVAKFSCIAHIVIACSQNSYVTSYGKTCLNVQISFSDLLIKA